MPELEPRTTKNVWERILIAAPLILFCELVVAVFLLSILFVADGESYNPQNNTGIGNVINAIGVVAFFYTIFGYGIARFVTLVATLFVRRNRRIWVGVVGAAILAMFGAMVIREAQGPTGLLWLVLALVVAFNLVLPLVIPRWILE